MNKEEIIDYLKSYAQPPQMMKVFPDFEIIKEAVSMLEQQEALPKSLAAAARRYAIPTYMNDVDENFLDEYPYDPVAERAFIAGAEWHKSHLTVQDIKKIVNIADAMLDDPKVRIAVQNHSEEEYYRKVLDEYSRIMSN